MFWGWDRSTIPLFGQIEIAFTKNIILKAIACCHLAASDYISAPQIRCIQSESAWENPIQLRRHSEKGAQHDHLLPSHLYFGSGLESTANQAR
jgi:hypothetical protein